MLLGNYLQAHLLMLLYVNTDTVVYRLSLVCCIAMHLDKLHTEVYYLWYNGQVGYTITVQYTTWNENGEGNSQFIDCNYQEKLFVE